LSHTTTTCQRGHTRQRVQRANGKPVGQRAAKCGACAGAVSRHTAGGLVGRLWQTWRPSGWYANVVWPRKRPTPKCCWQHLNPHPPFHRAVPSGSLTFFPSLGVKSQNPKKEGNEIRAHAYPSTSDRSMGQGWIECANLRVTKQGSRPAPSSLTTKKNPMHSLR